MGDFLTLGDFQHVLGIKIFSRKVEGGVGKHCRAYRCVTHTHTFCHFRACVVQRYSNRTPFSYQPPLLPPRQAVAPRWLAPLSGLCRCQGPLLPLKAPGSTSCCAGLLQDPLQARSNLSPPPTWESKQILRTRCLWRLPQASKPCSCKDREGLFISAWLGAQLCHMEPRCPAPEEECGGERYLRIKPLQQWYQQ